MSSSSGADGGGRDDAGASPGAIDERAIDRRLLDLLIARHGAPRPPPPLSAEDKEHRELIARRDRALAAADPGLLRHLERHRADAEELARRAPGVDAQLASRADDRGRLMARFDLGVWRLRGVGEPRELEPSQEVFEALEHRAPQAFLRDLHRPVVSFGDVQLRRLPSPVAGRALGRAHAIVREAMATRASGLATAPLASRQASEGYDELLATLARPWEESRPERPLPMPSSGPRMEDYQWFGLSGGYDPDL